MTGRCLLALAAALTAAAGCARETPTDYEIELGQIRDEIAELEGEGARAPVDPSTGPSTEVARATRHALLVFHRASLTADFDDFRAAEAAIDGALARVGPWPDLWFLKANLDFKLHRLARAREDLARIPELAGVPEIAALRADIELQEGRYDGARRGYEEVLGAARTWDNLARLAYLEAKTGDPAGADALYAEAADEITAKEMRAYAWVELQRGLLDLDAGRYDDALAHYRRADRAYSGYWLNEEHLAEALDLLGRTREAAALYRAIVERTGNPEFVSALAAIVARSDPAAAAALYVEADHRFQEQYRLYPEAALGHYLEHLLTRPPGGANQRPDLLELAEANHRLRPNGEAKALLARAYLELGQPDRARAVLDEILATPWRTPEVARLSQQLAVMAPSPQERSGS